jgi:SNF2 family DNA or RNA helicase
MIAREERPGHHHSVDRVFLPITCSDTEAELVRDSVYSLRGGILTLGPGAGKTSIVLSLVARDAALTLSSASQASQASSTLSSASRARGDLLESRATLIIVPPHLPAQWRFELQTRFGDSVKSVVVMGWQDLVKHTLEEICSADVLVLPSTSLRWPVWHERLTRILQDAGDTLTSFERASAHLRSFTRLRPASAAKLTLFDVPVQLITFRRVVYDEAHILLPPSHQESRMLTSLTHLRAGRRWVVTATPTLTRRGLMDLADLLQLHIGGLGEDLPGATEQLFLDTFARGGPAEVPSMRDLTLRRKLVSVDLSARERALYSYETRKEQLLSGGRLVLGERAVIRCTIVRGLADSEQVLSASQALQRFSQKLEECRRLNAINERRLDANTSATSEERRLLQSSIARGRGEERSLSFLVASLSAISDEGEMECSICLTDLGKTSARAVTLCGHSFHSDCLAQALLRARICPNCRSEVGEDASAPLVVHPSERDLESSATEDAVMRRTYGSKLAAVAHALRGIFGDEPDAKVLIFTQFASIALEAQRALGSFGIARLKGGSAEIAATLRNFETDASLRVLIMSLESMPCGTNLSRASHIFLLHPPLAATPQQAIDIEAQAIARALRPGQLRQVTAWNFVAAGTSEETAYDAIERFRTSLPS